MTLNSRKITECVADAFERKPELPRDCSVTVAIPDATRPLSYSRVVAPLVDKLCSRRCEVTLLVALGLHRPMNSRELRPLVEIARTWDIELEEHDPTATDVRCAHDPPALYSHRVADSDALVAVGTVEPHQYAGFSGGAKTFAIGCGGVEAIQYMHSFEFLRMPEVRVGSVKNNPFQEALWQMVASLKLPHYGVYVVPDGRDRAWSIHIGEARSAFEDAVESARRHHFERVEPARWMRLRVPSSKASSFYQASRAATYAALVAQPGILPGGWLLVEADCVEGMGQGRGEQACAQAMLRGVDTLLEELAGSRPAPRLKGGEQRAYVIARALKHAQIALVGARFRHEELAVMGIRQFSTLGDAIQDLGLDPADGLDVAQPFHRVPIAETDSAGD